MGDKEEEFPFECLVEALQEEGDMRGPLRLVLAQINDRNIYWTYSAVSTLVEILKSKDEEPHVKCRCLQALALLLDSPQYPLVTFLEVYILPLLTDIALYRGRKSEELASYYFQQVQAAEDTPQNKQLSLQFVERATELIFYLGKIKPQRTVETEELKQESNFSRTLKMVREKGLEEPKQWKWCEPSKFKDCRRRFLENMRCFGEESDDWTEFLLVNLLQEVRSGKKQLLQLRLLLNYGESYLTSAVINVCEDELTDLTDNLDLKRKYLALLNQLVRAADIEAIIMIKNSEFLPSIVANISKIPGHLGVSQGENILPEVKATKQSKREFYSDFLRCVQTWANVMPSDYDSEEFSIKSIFQYLKNEKKFKFPENMHLARYQKEIAENLERNKERNEKLIEILQNGDNSKQQSDPVSKVSNVLQRTTLLAPVQLENRLEEARKSLKDVQVDQISAQKAMKILTQFKQNWITYLEALDLEGADEARLQTLVFQGERTVQQIQLILPHFQNLQKTKLTYRQFKQKVKESLEHYNDLSVSKSHQVADKKSITSSKSIALSKLIQSKVGPSKFGQSKLGGKELMDKMKSKSKIGDATKLDLSRVMDRSSMHDRSKLVDKSKIGKSKLETSKKHSEQENLKSDKKKEITKKQQSSESQEDESVAKSYKVPEKMLKKQSESMSKPLPTTPTKQEKSVTKDNNTPTVEMDSSKKETLKKQKIVLQTPQRITRIADYQSELEDVELKPQQVSSRLDKSREKGSSRILLRRSHNRSSHKERSEGSDISEEKRSVSSKRLKENSIYKKGSVELANGKKVSEIEEQLLKEDKVKVNQTIQINGYDIDRANNDKKAPKLKQTNKMANFKDGTIDISSIQSNSVLRMFHHSAEKILNISGQEQSDFNESKPFTKQGARETVDHVAKPIVTPPLVGDYYQEVEPNHKPDVELTPKKQSTKSKAVEEQTSKKDYQITKEKEEKVSKKIDSSLLRGVFEKPKKEEQKKQVKELLKESKAQQNDRKHEEKIVRELRTVKIESIVERHGSTTKLADLRALEDAKNRQIQALQRKIQELERETVAMKNKLAVKDNELRSIKSKSGSQRGFAQFTSPSHSNYELASSAAKSKADKTSLRGSSAGKKVQNTRFQKEVQNNFKQYLERIKGSTFRKSLLKLKCLVHKSDEVEIGCMTKRNQKTMQCTLFITPHRYDVLDFSITIIHDHSLKIKTNPEHVKLIPVRKQQKINLTIEVVKIPFCLPEFEMNYKSNSEYSSNYNRLTLPIAFNKFCEIMPMNSESKSERHTSYVRTDDFKLNPKVIKLEKVSDSFPNFTVLPSTKQRQQLLLAASCVYQETSFNLMMNLHEKVSWIQGFLLEGDVQPMNFLICTLKQVLDGSKK